MNHVNIITVAEFGQLAPEVDTSTYDAPTVSGLISGASREVENYLEYSPFAEDIVDEVKNGMVDARGDLIIMPAKLPIISLSSLGLTKGTTTVSVQTQSDGVDRYNIDYTRRHIRMAASEAQYGDSPGLIDFGSLKYTQFYTKISYRGGWEVSDLPMDIKLATVYFMRELLAAKYNQSGAQSLSQGGVSFSFSGGMNPESRFIKEAKRLLGPYRRLG